MKTVFITGANRGIGLGLVKQFLNNNYRVIAACRDPLESALLELNHPHLIIVKLDVTAEDDFLQVKKNIGSIDILIANAGIKGYINPNPDRAPMPFWEFTPKNFNDAYQTNVIGAHNTIKHLLPEVNNSTDKAIFALGSGVGSVADNGSGGSAPYRCSKAALHQLIETVDRDCSKNKQFDKIIAVTLIPGWVKTDMGGAGARLEIPESCELLYKRMMETIANRQTRKLLMHNNSFMPF